MAIVFSLVSLLLPLTNIQVIFYTVVRTIPLKPKSNQASHWLRGLQWFPVSLQIVSELLTVVYKVIHNLDPHVPLWSCLLAHSASLSSPSIFLRCAKHAPTSGSLQFWPLSLACFFSKYPQMCSHTTHSPNVPFLAFLCLPLYILITHCPLTCFHLSLENEPLPDMLHIYLFIFVSPSCIP